MLNFVLLCLASNLKLYFLKKLKKILCKMAGYRVKYISMNMKIEYWKYILLCTLIFITCAFTYLPTFRNHFYTSIRNHFYNKNSNYIGKLLNANLDFMYFKIILKYIYELIRFYVWSDRYEKICFNIKHYIKIIRILN